MGVRAALAIAGSATALMAGPTENKSALYLLGRQQPDGGFAEVSGRSDPTLTAWVVLALRAVGADPRRASGSGASPADYLADQPYPRAADLALRILALRALGEDVGGLAAQLERLRRPSGRIGPLVNSTIWSALALRAAGRPAGRTTVRYVLAQQTRQGGWPWAPRGAADSNDTAAAIQALRAAGVGRRSRPIRRAVAYLRRLQNRDGGFPLLRGRASDAQSTAWVIQGLLAAGERPGPRPYAYLRRMRRDDGSYRYSQRYAVTPVWVTAQVLPAIAGRPFP